MTREYNSSITAYHGMSEQIRIAPLLFSFLLGIFINANCQHIKDLKFETSKNRAERNALLKSMHDHRLFDRESIEVWDEQLVSLGTEIHARRKSFIDEFVAVFQERYLYIGEVSDS